MSLTLTCEAFKNGESIPGKFTCSGVDASPALAWSGVPTGTRSLALIVDDPDAGAGTWVHWLIFNIPAEATALPEGVPGKKELDDGAKQGRNDFRKIGYAGPCPPPGGPHRYFFRLYALDMMLDLASGATRDAVEQAMNGHILAETHLMGKFKR
jgi:Raf kinase inhibitor-like YbhB/YbcL family protein